MDQLEVGLIGLKNAGKTVFHSVLYGHRNNFRNVTVSFPDEASIEYLKPKWESLDRGVKPEFTQLANPTPIVWIIRQTEENGEVREFNLRTIDHAGILAARGRDEDVRRIAAESGFNTFVDRCDILFFLIDISDDSQVHAQLDTLEYILQRAKEVPTNRGSRVRPIALLFTKCDQVLADLQAHYALAREQLLHWMEGHDKWRQVSSLYRAQVRNQHPIEVFPVSCFGCKCGPDTSPPRGAIEPRWMHEPILWAAQSGSNLARAARQLALLRRVALCAAPFLVIALICFWVYFDAHGVEMAVHRKVEVFCHEHAAPADAVARMLQRAAFLNARRTWRSRWAIETEVLDKQREAYHRDLEVAEQLISADQKAYEKLRTLLPIQSWASLPAVSEAAHGYLEADDNQIAKTMKASAESLHDQIRAIAGPAPGLEIKFLKVSTLASAEKLPETTKVYFGHYRDETQDHYVEVASDERYSPDIPRLNVEPICLYFSRKTEGSLWIGVRDAGGKIAWLKEKLGDSMFRPNMDLSSTIEGRFRVEYRINCPSLTNLLLPVYQRPALPKLEAAP